MVFEDTSEFDDILFLDGPVSTHAHMSQADRAKQFSPFAALSGYEDSIDAQNIRRQNKPQLTDEELSGIAEALSKVSKRDTVSITYFLHNPGTDGAGGFAEGFLITTTGTIESIEPAYQFLKLRTDEPDHMPAQRIAFDDILAISPADP